MLRPSSRTWFEPLDLSLKVFETVRFPLVHWLFLRRSFIYHGHVGPDMGLVPQQSQTELRPRCKFLNLLLTTVHPLLRDLTRSLISFSPHQRSLPSHSFPLSTLGPSSASNHRPPSRQAVPRPSNWAFLELRGGGRGDWEMEALLQEDDLARARLRGWGREPGLCGHVGTGIRQGRRRWQGCCSRGFDRWSYIFWFLFFLKSQEEAWMGLQVTWSRSFGSGWWIGYYKNAVSLSKPQPGHVKCWANYGGVQCEVTSVL
jgi:hypothetical protein